MSSHFPENCLGIIVFLGVRVMSTPSTQGYARIRPTRKDDHEYACERDLGYEIQEEPAEDAKSPIRLRQARSLSCNIQVKKHQGEIV